MHKIFAFVVLVMFAPLVLFSQTDETQYPIDEMPSIADTGGSQNAINENETALSLDDRSFSGGVTIWSVVRIFLVLVMIAFAIYGFIYLYKNKIQGLRGAKTRNTQTDSYLKILAATPINAKSTAAIVAVGKQAWLVGISETAVTPISEITDTQIINSMLVDYSAGAAEGAATVNFFTMLQTLVPPSMRPSAPPGQEDTAQRIRKSRERLRDI
jgi:flagellar biogenesis protein FliO